MEGKECQLRLLTKQALLAPTERTKHSYTYLWITKFILNILHITF